MVQYISIGGWCGTRIALDQLKITNEPHNIFDFVRSSSKGIIDCLQTDFASFLPENKQVDTRFVKWKPIIGEHFGFYHGENLTVKSMLDSIDRKIKRWEHHCHSDKKCIFVRTCVLPDYESELKDMKVLEEVITKNYPQLSFIIVFILPDQEVTAYYNNIGNKIFMFCLQRSPEGSNISMLGELYKNIFEFISENDLFNSIPPPPPHHDKIKITTPLSHLCLVENLPAVHYFEKYK